MLRHRERMVEYAASHIQHMQKALMQLNVQLHHVISEITGRTGMQILRAICHGERNPRGAGAVSRRSMQGVRRRDPRGTDWTLPAGTCVHAARHSISTMPTRAKIGECDREIESALAEINRDRPPAKEPLPQRRDTGGRNEPRFDVRAALYTLLGRDLTQIHGLGAYTVLRLVGECGDDMTKWRTAKHFTPPPWTLRAERAKRDQRVDRPSCGRLTSAARSRLLRAAVFGGAAAAVSTTTPPSSAKPTRPYRTEGTPP
jgi:transposase